MCGRPRALRKNSQKFFWDSLKGSKILKNQKNCPEFWVFGFFCLFWTPPNFFFSFFLKYMSRRKFWYTTFENRIKTKVAGTFWVFDTCRPYFDPPVGVPISDFFFLKVHVFSYPKIHKSQNQIFDHFLRPRAPLIIMLAILHPA